MDDNIATFLAFTATEDTAVAKQFLELSGDNVEYAVQLFMESGSTNQPSNDEDLAQRLQQEAYQDSNVREADATVHRHETLQDSFASSYSMPFNSAIRNVMESSNAIFGRGRTGVFNQRFEMLDDDDDDDDDDDEEDEDIDYDDEQNDGFDDDIEEVGSSEPMVVEIDLDSEDASESLPRRTTHQAPLFEATRNNGSRSRRARRREEYLSELTLTQRRLADLFKPPFDIMSRISLEDAKVQGRREQKWILINIQDNSEFQCQVLNRDFWSKPEIKRAVKESFIFLQYHVDSPLGEMFCNFYHVDKYPYICILDPMTGERVRQWPSGVVPDVVDWLSDIELFLEKFLLKAGSQNPIVEHEVRFDPDAMSEEQQIEYALKQSIAAGASLTETGNVAADAVAVAESDPFDSIIPQDHVEPSNGTVTRIQIRFPTGKRLVHKFDYENDKVICIYQWLKHILAHDYESTYGICSNDTFQITCPGNSIVLVECLETEIGKAGLKNASLLVEKS